MTEVEKWEECIENLNQQIGWIEDIKAHQFPGWGHTVGAMRQAIALMKAQEPVSIEERLVLDKLHTIQDYARVNEIHWMADGAAFAENVMNMLRGEINQFRKAQEPRLLTPEDFKYNPDVDAGGFLPCWVECNEVETENAVKMGIIQHGETVDGWTEADVESMPGGKNHNPNVRYWTSRPTEAQREAEPWPEV